MRLTKLLATTSTSVRFPLVRIHFVLTTIISLALFGHVRAATITANSVSRADVGAAVAAAVDGDIVLIPSGSAHWTTNLTISKAITLQGAGTNSTVIYDDLPVGSVTPSVIWILTTANKTYRLSGIHFAGSTARTSDPGSGEVVVSGSSRAVRIDHCLFDAAAQRLLCMAWFDSCGVVDHCVLSHQSIKFDMGRWMATTDRIDGTGSWSAPDYWGTTNMVVVEDCYLENAGSTSGFTDAYNGARYCIRYCTLKNGHLDSHEDIRPVREVEIYNNDFTADDNNGMIYNARGGSCVIFSNTTHGNFNFIGLLANYRLSESSPPWGMVNGVNPWDNNSSSPTKTGTYVGLNGAQDYIVFSNANWTVNQWAGYTIQNTTVGRTNADGKLGGSVFSNTTNMLVLSGSAHPVTRVAWTNGDTYAFYYITNSMDMCGMGQCAIVVANNLTPSPVRYLQNASNPCYEWGNGASIYRFFSTPIIRSGIHYFNNTPKPGYVPLVYPHPLQFATSGSSSSNTSKVLPPSGLIAISPN